MDRWCVESGNVRAGDFLVMTVKHRYLIDNKTERDLADVTIRQLRSIGYRVYRMKKSARQKIIEGHALRSTEQGTPFVKENMQS